MNTLALQQYPPSKYKVKFENATDRKFMVFLKQIYLQPVPYHPQPHQNWRKKTKKTPPKKASTTRESVVEILQNAEQDCIPSPPCTITRHKNWTHVTPQFSYSLPWLWVRTRNVGMGRRKWNIVNYKLLKLLKLLVIVNLISFMYPLLKYIIFLDSPNLNVVFASQFQFIIISKHIFRLCVYKL